MVEITNDGSAIKPKSCDQAQNSDRDGISLDIFQQLYQSVQKAGVDAIKNAVEDKSANFKNVSHKETLTLAFNPALKELPHGNVTRDGSIAFDAKQDAKQDAKSDTPEKKVEVGVKKDANGHVVEVDYANGQSRKFGYDEKGKLNQITDLDGSVAKLDEKTGQWVYQKSTHGISPGDSNSGHPVTIGGGSDQHVNENKTDGSLRRILNLVSGVRTPDYINPKVSDDGTFSYSTGDGKDKTFNPDGSSRIVDTRDGSSFKTNTDGRVTEIDYGNGKNRKFEYIKDGNGGSHLSKFTDTDGKVYSLKDGRWLNADGSDSGLSGVSVTRDGQFKQTNKEGLTTTFATDLSKTVENQNHSIVQQDKNGKILGITYENCNPDVVDKSVSFGYADNGELNKIIDADGKIISKGKNGKWTDKDGNDTGIRDVRLQPDGSYTYKDKDNHLVINGTDGKPRTTTETIDQIKRAAQEIHDAENHKTLGFFGSPDGGKVIDIIKNLSPTDRLVLEQQYQQLYGKKLTDDISHTLDKKDAARANELLYITNLQEDAAKFIPDAVGSDGKSQRQAFLDNMNTFLDRAHQGGISDEEIAKTFAATQRLLEAKDGRVSAVLREQLAQQIMAQAAHPENTDQGQHLTCNVTDVQVRTLTNHPSVVAEMLADVALNGFYTASDRKKITIPPQNFIPDGEALTNPPKDGARSFATQLLNATMCNDIGQRETPPKYYTQLAPMRDGSTGEYWTDANGKPLMRSYRDEHGLLKQKPIEFAGISYTDISLECKRLTGETNTTFLNDDFDASDEVVHFHTEKDLLEKFENAKKSGTMPIIIDVSAEDPLFGGKYPAGDTSVDIHGIPNRHGADHVVCIDNYNPDTGMVHINNTWGTKRDMWVPLHDLYQATRK